MVVYIWKFADFVNLVIKIQSKIHWYDGRFFCSNIPYTTDLVNYPIFVNHYETYVWKWISFSPTIPAKVNNLYDILKVKVVSHQYGDLIFELLSGT